MSLDRSIDLCIPRDACHKLFCVLGTFYVSGTPDAEVTKSLKCEMTILEIQTRDICTSLRGPHKCKDAWNKRFKSDS